MLKAATITIGVFIAVVHCCVNMMFTLSYGMSGPELHGKISSVLHIPFPRGLYDVGFHPWVILILNAVAWGAATALVFHYLIHCCTSRQRNADP